MTLESDVDARDDFLAVDTLNVENSFEGFRRVETITYREEESRLEARREIVVAHRAVAVIAYDPKLRRLVLIRQFRIGAQMANSKGFCVEVVAGLIDPGETAESTAIRELKEEAGLQAQRVEKICQFLTTPGLSDEMIDLYYAEVDASDLVHTAGLDGETEQTFPFTISLASALKAMDDNLFFNGIAMIALMRFEREYQRLTGQRR